MAQQQGTQTPPAGPPEEPRSLTDQLRLAGAALAALALIIFFLQNLQEVEINFLFWEWQTDMIWALIVSAILGALGAFFVSTVRRWRRQRQTPEQRPRED